jgi:hypothetical protein
MYLGNLHERVNFKSEIDLNINKEYKFVAGSITDEVFGFFKWPNPFQPHYDPGVDSASNRNEYLESSWW